MPAILSSPPTPVPTPSLFGRFSFWGAAAPVPVPTPLLTRESASSPPDAMIADAVSTVLTENSDISEGVDELDEITLDQVKIEHDGGLLGLSWKNMLSITPSISSALKLRNQDLQGDLNRCSENPQSAYGLPMYTSISQVEAPLNTGTTGAFFNSTGRNTQVADILAKKQVPSVPLIPVPSTSMSSATSSNTDLKDSEDEVSNPKISTPPSFVHATIGDSVSPVVQLGHFSNGDRILRRSHTPSPVLDLAGRFEGTDLSTDALIENNIQREGGMILFESTPKVLDASPIAAAEEHEGPVIGRMSRTHSNHNSERDKSELAVIKECSAGGETLLMTGTPDVCTVNLIRDVSIHVSIVSTPSSTTQTLPVQLSVHEELSSPSSSSLSTSEDNFILIKPTIRAASRKISDYVQIV